jgi:HEAT repeat protein
MDPGTAAVAVGALAQLVATSVQVVAGRAWKSFRDPEVRVITAAAGAALDGSLRASVLPAGAVVDDQWVGDVADVWLRAFTPDVLRKLVECLADPSGVLAGEFAAAAGQALEDSGCDLAVLGRSFWVDEFLCLLPRRFFSALRAASLRDERVRGLVDHLLHQREDARADREWPVSPAEFQQDLIGLVRNLDEQAITGRLPPYLPARASVITLSRTVRVRLGVRHMQDGRELGVDQDEIDVGRAYRLPGERSGDSTLPRPWPEVALKYRRLVVLADPGMGKSWLIRIQTHRLCEDALAMRDEPRPGLTVPVPLRCDQLVAADGPDLADKAAGFLVSQGLLSDRSRAGLAGMLRAGQAVLLLDALDELSVDQKGPLMGLVQSWAAQAGDNCRCLITSRIAGYTGPPIPHANEVELVAFTPAESAAAVAAWRLPDAGTARLLERMKDPAIAAMARIPLLLALLCSVTMQEAGGLALPRTRGQLYERILRWFLTGAHRSLDSPASPARDDLAVAALLEILAPLAFAFATPNGWIDRMPAGRILEAIRTSGAAFTELRRPAADVLRELSQGAGILVPEGNPSEGRDPPYLFLHRTVAEYLVARHLAGLLQRDWLAAVDQHRWFDAEWAEVIPMIGERLAAASAYELIRHLTDGEPDPFHHSLFLAIRVWGARADADGLLPVEQAENLASEVGRLLVSPRQTVRTTALACLAGMAFLPRPLVARLLVCLVDQDWEVRRDAERMLAGRQDRGVTEALIALLGGRDENGRRSATELLAGRQGPGVIEALTARLADSDYLVRQEAVKALAGEEGPGVTEALLSGLTDDEWPVRSAAVNAAAGREGQAVTEGLVSRLADPENYVRRHAVEALAGREGSGVTEALIACLADNDWSVRFEVVKALASREGPGVADGLLARLADGNELVRSSASRALAQRGEPAVTEALLERLTDRGLHAEERVGALAGQPGAAVTDALVTQLADRDTHVRKAAVKALAGREDPGAAEGLLTRLSDPDEAVRREAVGALAWRQDAGITEAMLGCLADSDWPVRHLAMEAVAGSGVIDVGDIYHFTSQPPRKAHTGRAGPEVTKGLLECLGHHDQVMRFAATDALAIRAEPGVTEALLSYLAHESWDVRYGAAKALGRRKGQDATKGLLVISAHQETRVRRAAVELLASRDGTDVTDALLSCLADQDAGVRSAAAGSLAGRTGKDVTEGLLTCLADQDAEVRYAAAKAVATRESPGVTQALLGCLADDNERVRRTAVDALAGRTGTAVTDGLLSCLLDKNSGIRGAAVKALTGRERHGMTEALLTLAADNDSWVRRSVMASLSEREGNAVTEALLGGLADNDERLRSTVTEVLANRNPSDVLLTLACMARKQSKSMIGTVSEAERLMTRYYSRINPAKQSEVRAAMALLTNAT